MKTKQAKDEAFESCYKIATKGINKEIAKHKTVKAIAWETAMRYYQKSEKPIIKMLDVLQLNAAVLNQADTTTGIYQLKRILNGNQMLFKEIVKRERDQEHLNFLIDEYDKIYKDAFRVLQELEDKRIQIAKEFTK